jgi:feruloyl esterase
MGWKTVWKTHADLRYKVSFSPEHFLLLPRPLLPWTLESQLVKMRLLNSSLLFPALLLLSNATVQAHLETRNTADNIAKCEAFGASLHIENVTVNFANFVPAGTNLTFTQDYNLSTCGIPSQVVSVDLCRIAMYVATSTRSGM